MPYERFPDWIDENVKDPEEKLGYALFENNSLAPEIKAAGMEGYFDYKAYGRDEAINSYDIGDHGFVNKRISIDVEKYSYEEIQNQLKENGLDESMEYKEENQILKINRTSNSFAGVYNNPIEELYPINSEIDVYYDPSNPKLSYVLRYCNKKWLFYLTFCSALLTLVIDLLILFVL